MKDTIIEMKNNLQVKHSIVVVAENQINDLEHKEAKSNQNNKKKKQSKKNEDSISNLWDNFKRSNIHIIGVPEEEKKQEIRNLFEKIMKENFHNLVKDIDMQVQEAQRVPNERDVKRSTPRQIIVNMLKIKDKEMGCGMGEWVRGEEMKKYK